MDKPFNTPNSISAPGGGSARASAMAAVNNPPPSVPLQIFLFCAFLITAGAYIISQRGEPTDADQVAQEHNDKLHHMYAETDRYRNFTKNGFMAESVKDYAGAVSNFHSASIIRDVMLQNRAEAHYNYGCALLLQSPTNAPRAFQEFQEALHFDAGMRDVYTSWGQALMESGQPAEAEKVYRRGVEANPLFPVTHYKLALALAAQGKDTNAVTEMAQAAKLGMDDTDFWTQYGRVLNSVGRYSQAETTLTNALRIRADLLAVLFQIGLAQENQGKFADAISEFDKILSQKPDDADALNELALIYATASDETLRNPRQAISYATQASTSVGDRNPHYLDTLARSYAASGDYAQAIVWEKKAIQQTEASGDKLFQGELRARFAMFQQGKAP